MPNNFDPPWVGQQRRSAVDEAIWISVVAALVVWVAKHWYIPAVRFVTGVTIGYVVGLVAIGAALSGTTSSAAVWLTVVLAAFPAAALGGLLGRFAGKVRKGEDKA